MTATTPAVGQRVEWRMEHNKGWGGAWWVPAVVVSVGRVRVTIDAYLSRGGTKRVAVQPDRLRGRTYLYGSEL
jgi:hypothetical protein